MKRKLPRVIMAGSCLLHDRSIRLVAHAVGYATHASGFGPFPSLDLRNGFGSTRITARDGRASQRLAGWTPGASATKEFSYPIDTPSCGGRMRPSMSIPACIMNSG